MTERRKAKVGDTIRLNGKNHAHRGGERVVTDVVDQTFRHEDGISTYYVTWETGEKGHRDAAWELQFDIVEKFNKGDKVKLTPKDGGETVIYGEFLGTTFSHNVLVTGAYPNSFRPGDWNIELMKPTTEEILNALGENAYVAHRTDPDWRAYAKVNGEWHEVGRQFEYEISAADVGGFIELNDFEIIFEGIKDE